MKALLYAAAVTSVIGIRAGAQDTPPATSAIHARMPSEVGAFDLVERTSVQGMPTDSVYRYSDGSRTRLTVIVYDVEPDVKVDADPQLWTAREADKFRLVLEQRKSGGQITAYAVALSDTTRMEIGGHRILESRIVAPVRFRNGVVAVDMQFLYLVGSKFVKVRATMPGEGWQQSEVPSFARELAQRLADGS